MGVVFACETATLRPKAIPPSLYRRSVMNSSWWDAVARSRDEAIREQTTSAKDVPRRAERGRGWEREELDRAAAQIQGIRRSALRVRALVAYLDRFSLKMSARACAALLNRLQVVEAAAELSVLVVRHLKEGRRSSRRTVERRLQLISRLITQELEQLKEGRDIRQRTPPGPGRTGASAGSVTRPGR